MITSSGGCVESSRLESASAVELVVSSTTLQTPGALTSALTSIVFHIPAVTAPEDPTFVAEMDPDGWFAVVHGEVLATMPSRTDDGR